MRKAIMSLLVVLSLWGATSWQPPQPLRQWKVVMEQHRVAGPLLTNVPLFTPKPNAVYRISAQCNAYGEEGGGWNFTISWSEFSGASGGAGIICETGHFVSTESVVAVFVPKDATPVTVSGNPYGVVSQYDAIYVLEELQ